MPMVGSKKFAYAPEGKKAAQEYADKTGKSMKSYKHGGMHSSTKSRMYAGGGSMKSRYKSGGIIQHDQL